MLNLKALFDWLESLPLSQAILESSWMFPTIESAHVVSISLVVGLVMIFDLRVLGLTSKRKAVSELSREVLPWTWLMFAIAAVSGALMFASNANKYFDNFAFQFKMLLIVAAGINMLFFHFGPYKMVTQWNENVNAPMLARLCCGLSLVFWILVVGAGRWIGFTIFG